jgi:natural product biosynthesis luciferase-like monooxygenase protein
MKFGLFYFSDAEDKAGGDELSLYLATAQKADQLGLDAIWTPERHFTQVGAAYPNPSVLSAALAVTTRQIALRSGSVIVPLHDSIRVAEEWAVVDRLSNGRVGLSFGSGWVPNDFVLAPELYADRHQAMLRKVGEVRALWRGEPLKRTNGNGVEVEVRSQPRPLQSELPCWLTSAGSERTFQDAGRIGANVLTNLFSNSVANLTQLIELYRQARAAAGHDPLGGGVAVMLHTFLEADPAEAVATARPALAAYFEAQLRLRMRVWADHGDASDMADDDFRDLVELSAERYLAEKSLIGSVDSCLSQVAALWGAGVTEIACLVDFGLPQPTIIKSLPWLRDLQVRAKAAFAAPG